MGENSGKSVCEEGHYRQVYQENAEQLRNFLYYKCGNLSLAEDLAQESFIKLWENCASVIWEKAKGFLFTVANRLFLDVHRSQKVALRFEKEQGEQSIERDDPHFILRTKEFKESLEKAISNLPEGQREVFLMNRIDGLTYKEIAQMLGVSQTAVEKRMGKALSKLKSNIEALKDHPI